MQHKYDDLLKRRDNLDIENAGLRSKVKLLEEKVKILEEANKKGHDLEEKLIELKGQQVEHEKVKMEKNSLENNLEAVHSLLNERVFNNIKSFISLYFLIT